MKKLLFVAVAALTLGLTPAMATSTTYTLSYLGDSEATSLGTTYEQLTIYGPGLSLDGEAGAAGPITLNVAGSDGSNQNILLYCTDIKHYFSSGGTYTLGLLSDTLTDPTKLAQVNALLSNAKVSDAASGAALQVAIWEVENETGTSSYNVTSGSFSVAVYGSGTIDPTMVTDAENDLANVEGDIWTWKPAANAVVSQFESTDGTDQDFAFLTVSAPEPASAALLGAGLLLLAVSRRQCRSARA